MLRTVDKLHDYAIDGVIGYIRNCPDIDFEKPANPLHAIDYSSDYGYPHNWVSRGLLERGHFSTHLIN